MAKQIKVREDNYFAVQGWMVTELKLKGNLVIKKPYQLPTKRVIKKSFPAPPITLFDFIYFSSKI